MVRKLVAIYVCLTFAVSLAVAADGSAARGGLTAAQIVDKNVAARGGLQAWRAVQTMSLQGKLGAGGNQRATLAMPGANDKAITDVAPRRPVDETQLPFLMELKRGRKMRFEMQFKGQTAVQVYDGANGWKLRPFLNRLEVEPFTADEVKIASMQEDLDGPLVDYAAKGTSVELVGMEQVESRDTYKLKLTKKNGQAIHVWIDAKTFLEAKIEGQPRRLDGTEHPVELYYRDYRTVDGLQIPFVLETRLLPVTKTALGFRDTPVPPEKIVIDKVAVNPKLDEKLFSKPEIVVARNGK
jgi:hypothetical protein